MKKLLGLISVAILIPSLALALTLTKPLSLGSTGPDVTTLQQLLQTNGYLSIAPTGYFGTLTQAAVQKYQVAHSIVTSGTPATTGFGAV
ncbi:MAG TPA: peptidoglycan-binding domain-containing protein, partial [Candidatus Paceibacterota bacterium]|nr:peptidoglycan-binding domain-containing protein [Candidatus Paceibacterota bacterium]